MGISESKDNGFSGLKGLIIVIVMVSLIITGVMVLSVNKNSNSASVSSSHQNQNTSSTTKMTSSDAMPNSAESMQIVAAVKSYVTTIGYTSDSATVDTSKILINGSNAKGNITFTDGGGAGFVAHKTDSNWKVVWEGQQEPGKKVGSQYNLPNNWYSNNFN